MVLESTIVMGYLTRALMRGGERAADRATDALLDRLVALARSRIGPGAMELLAMNPADESTQRTVSTMLDGAASVDSSFARELAELVSQLDASGGHNIFNEVSAHTNQQAYEHSTVVGRDYTYVNASHPGDLSDAALWVKAGVAIGALASLIGFIILSWIVVTAMTSDAAKPDFHNLPPGAGLFVAGMVISGVAQMGKAMSKQGA